MRKVILPLVLFNIFFAITSYSVTESDDLDIWYDPKIYQFKLDERYPLEYGEMMTLTPRKTMKLKFDELNKGEFKENFFGFDIYDELECSKDLIVFNKKEIARCYKARNPIDRDEVFILRLKTGIFTCDYCQEEKNYDIYRYNEKAAHYNLESPDWPETSGKFIGKCLSNPFQNHIISISGGGMSANSCSSVKISRTQGSYPSDKWGTAYSYRQCGNSTYNILNYTDTCDVYDFILPEDAVCGLKQGPDCIGNE